MNEGIEQQPEDPEQARKDALAQKLDTAGWGLFFIWIGTSFLANLGIGIGLLGVALITLGEQIARIYFRIKPQFFWIIVGVVFLLGGLWHQFGVEVQLMPVLLILAGTGMLISAFLGKHGLGSKDR